jgi:ATP dependent DNA ligase domain
MRKLSFEPCIPTRGTKVPAGPDWIHEIKHDGYRLIVQREGKRVRLLTRNRYDWSDRYRLIVQAALRGAEIDQEGQRFADDDAACREATKVAAEHVTDLKDKFQIGDEWRLEVTSDMQKESLYVIRFSLKRTS